MQVNDTGNECVCAEFPKVLFINDYTSKISLMMFVFSERLLTSYLSSN